MFLVKLIERKELKRRIDKIFESTVDEIAWKDQWLVDATGGITLEGIQNGYKLLARHPQKLDPIKG